DGDLQRLPHVHRLRREFVRRLVQPARVEDAFQQANHTVPDFHRVVEEVAEAVGAEVLPGEARRLDVGVHRHDGIAHLMVDAGDELVFQLVEPLRALVGDTQTAQLVQRLDVQIGGDEGEDGGQPLPANHRGAGKNAISVWRAAVSRWQKEDDGYRAQ